MEFALALALAVNDVVVSESFEDFEAARCLIKVSNESGNVGANILNLRPPQSNIFERSLGGGFGQQ